MRITGKTERIIVKAKRIIGTNRIMGGNKRIIHPGLQTDMIHVNILM